jgi:hypothetical protein
MAARLHSVSRLHRFRRGALVTADRSGPVLPVDLLHDFCPPVHDRQHLVCLLGREHRHDAAGRDPASIEITSFALGEDLDRVKRLNEMGVARTLVEFARVVDAVHAAIDVQRAMMIRNADFMPEKRIEFRIGIHLGDVMVESGGDLMGDGVNIAARLEGLARPGTICLSEDAYRQVRGRLDLAADDLGEKSLRNIAEKVRFYALDVGKPAQATPTNPAAARPRKMLLPLVDGIVVLLVAVAVGAWYFLGASRAAPVASNISAPAEAGHLQGRVEDTRPLWPGEGWFRYQTGGWLAGSGSAQEAPSQCPQGAQP